MARKIIHKAMLLFLCIFIKSHMDIPCFIIDYPLLICKFYITHFIYNPSGIIEDPTDYDIQQNTLK